MFVFYERKLLATGFPNVNKIARNLEMNEKPDRCLRRAGGQNRLERVAEQGGSKRETSFIVLLSCLTFILTSKHLISFITSAGVLAVDF